MLSCKSAPSETASLLEKGCVPALCGLLASSEPSSLLSALSALMHMFKCAGAGLPAEEKRAAEALVAQIEEASASATLEGLKIHDHPDVRHLVPEAHDSSPLFNGHFRRPVSSMPA